MNKFLLLYLIVLPNNPADEAHHKFTRVVIEHVNEDACSRMADVINSTTGKDWSPERLEELRKQRWLMNAPDKMPPHGSFHYATNSNVLIAQCSDTNPEAMRAEMEPDEGGDFENGEELWPHTGDNEGWSHSNGSKTYYDRIGPPFDSENDSKEDKENDRL